VVDRKFRGHPACFVQLFQRVSLSISKKGNNMLALGIDPGTAICGYAVVNLAGNHLTPIHYGAVLTEKDMLMELRLKKYMKS